MGRAISREDYFEVRKIVGPGSPKVADVKGSRK
jgi:hypothetical protein